MWECCRPKKGKKERATIIKTTTTREREEQPKTQTLSTTQSREHPRAEKLERERESS